MSNFCKGFKYGVILLFCLNMICKRNQQQENKLAQETDTCFVYLFGGKARILCLSKQKGTVDEIPVCSFITRKSVFQKQVLIFCCVFFSFNKSALPVLLYLFFGLTSMGIFGRVHLESVHICRSNY